MNYKKAIIGVIPLALILLLSISLVYAEDRPDYEPYETSSFVLESTLIYARFDNIYGRLWDLYYKPIGIDYITDVWDWGEKEYIWIDGTRIWLSEIVPVSLSIMAPFSFEATYHIGVFIIQKTVSIHPHVPALSFKIKFVNLDDMPHEVKFYFTVDLHPGPIEDIFTPKSTVPLAHSDWYDVPYLIDELDSDNWYFIVEKVNGIFYAGWWTDAIYLYWDVCEDLMPEYGGDTDMGWLCDLGTVRPLSSKGLLFYFGATSTHESADDYGQLLS